MSTIGETAAALRRGDTSCERIVEQALASVRSWEPRLNAWIAVSEQAALEDAHRLNLELEAGADRGPLHGIPLGIKDNLTTAGFPTTLASALPARAATEEDADSVRRLRQAGAVILGKTNLHEMAMGNPYASAVGNPFDLTRNASGSSSGTAAATAAGSIFGGLGTDSGGSIRLPAAVCGVVGLKPTFGRVSLRGLIGGSYTMDHIGPIARSVSDVRLLYRALVEDGRARAPRDPEHCPVVGLVTQLSAADPTPEVAGLVEQAGDRLREANVSVREVELSGLELVPYAAIGYAWPEISSQQPDLRTQHALYGDAIRPLLYVGEILSSRHYLLAQRARRYFRRRVVEAMSGVDALLMPTTPMTAGPRFEDPNTQEVIGGSSPDLFRFTRYTLPWNVTGFPALTVPCGRDSEGLPVGAQFVARPYDEELLFDLGALHERLMTWQWPELPGGVADSSRPKTDGEARNDGQ